VKRQELSPWYLANNDSIFGLVGVFLIFIVILIVIHWPPFVKQKMVHKKRLTNNINEISKQENIIQKKYQESIVYNIYSSQLPIWKIMEIVFLFHWIAKVTKFPIELKWWSSFETLESVDRFSFEKSFEWLYFIISAFFKVFLNCYNYNSMLFIIEYFSKNFYYPYTSPLSLVVTSMTYYQYWKVFNRDFVV